MDHHGFYPNFKPTFGIFVLRDPCNKTMVKTRVTPMDILSPTQSASIQKDTQLNRTIYEHGMYCWRM